MSLKLILFVVFFEVGAPNTTVDGSANHEVEIGAETDASVLELDGVDLGLDLHGNRHGADVEESDGAGGHEGDGRANSIHSGQRTGLRNFVDFGGLARIPEAALGVPPGGDNGSNSSERSGSKNADLADGERVAADLNGIRSVGDIPRVDALVAAAEVALAVGGEDGREDGGVASCGCDGAGLDASVVAVDVVLDFVDLDVAVPRGSCEVERVGTCLRSPRD